MNNSKSLTVVQLNDIHSYVDLQQEMFWQGDQAVYRPAGGYACFGGVTMGGLASPPWLAMSCKAPKETS